MRLVRRLSVVLALAFGTGACVPHWSLPASTLELGVVIERTTGAVTLVGTHPPRILGRVTGLGDLSHASAVFSPDGRYAFVFGRDGGVSKLDLLQQRLVSRVVQAGNTIGGAISSDGRWLAVANYEPGGLRILSTTDLRTVAELPTAPYGGGRVVGVADTYGNRFACALFDAGEIWIVELDAEGRPRLHRFPDAGRQPYDGLVTPDGRYYVVGLYGEDGLRLVDLWHLERGVRPILTGYGRGQRRLPVYKMPHLEGWALAGDELWLPAVGEHAVLVADRRDFILEATIPTPGQPVFVVARPDGREVWVDFAFPHNDRVIRISTEDRRILEELRPGKGVLHIAFTPRSQMAWVSVRDADVVVVYDAEGRERARLAIPAPSGIFFVTRAMEVGL